MFDRPIIALDRDGTLIEEGDYLTDPRRVKFLPGAIPGLKRLKKAGFPVIVISNQSGLARGFITPTQMRRVNHRFTHLLKRNKVFLDGYYWCPHAPGDHCSCRKPKLGMLKQAARELKHSWRQAVSIGDRPSDVLVGQRAGGQGVLVLTGYGRRWGQSPQPVKPDFTAPTFLKAVDWIIKKKGKNRR